MSLGTFSEIHTYIHTYIGLSAVWPVHFIESFLWAPPAATQFSVVRAPPVATLVSFLHFVSSYLWAPPVASQFPGSYPGLYIGESGSLDCRPLLLSSPPFSM